MEGALLRLRPKVMTVSTVVAGLLPIMWSTRVGAEVMKPLATPVLGGMVSSLLHVLIVTPVIFFWIRARSLPHEDSPPFVAREALTTSRIARHPRRRVVIASLALVLIAMTASLSWVIGRRSLDGAADGGGAEVVQIVRAGDLDVVLSSTTGRLRQGRNTFTIEFRRTGTRTLVDVGAAGASANMPMPGMVMSSGMQVAPTGTPGRYTATAEFGMAGAWQMAIEWDGPAGKGSVNFQGGVQ